MCLKLSRLADAHERDRKNLFLKDLETGGFKNLIASYVLKGDPKNNCRNLAVFFDPKFAIWLERT